MIELLAKQYDTKAFKVYDYLVSQRRVLSEVEDIYFLIKHKQSVPDRESVIVKTLSDGSITVDDAYIYVHFTPSDYDAGRLVGNEKYVYGLGFKFPDLDVLLEPKITNIDGKMANFVTVLPNFINN